MTSKMIWAIIILGYVYVLPRTLEWVGMFIESLKPPQKHPVLGADERMKVRK